MTSPAPQPTRNTCLDDGIHDILKHARLLQLPSLLGNRAVRTLLRHVIAQSPHHGRAWNEMHVYLADTTRRHLMGSPMACMHSLTNVSASAPSSSTIVGFPDKCSRVPS